eukprot:10706465-Lingulodinium_polyedra.AAC.1
MADVGPEQERLFAERLAAIFKKDTREMKKELQVVFKADAEYDLSPNVLSFAFCANAFGAFALRAWRVRVRSVCPVGGHGALRS